LLDPHFIDFRQSFPFGLFDHQKDNHDSDHTTAHKDEEHPPNANVPLPYWKPEGDNYNNHPVDQCANRHAIRRQYLRIVQPDDGA